MCVCIDDNLPIQEVIDAGVVPRLVEFLQDCHPPQLQVWDFKLVIPLHLIFSIIIRGY